MRTCRTMKELLPHSTTVGLLLVCVVPSVEGLVLLMDIHTWMPLAPLQTSIRNPPFRAWLMLPCADRSWLPTHSWLQEPDSPGSEAAAGPASASDMAAAVSAVTSGSRHRLHEKRIRIPFVRLPCDGQR